MQSAKKDKVVTVKPTVLNTSTGAYAKDNLKDFILFIGVLLLVLD
jgi:hypothetical protein